MNQRYMLQPRPHVRIYRADDGTSIPNPLFLRDMLREGLSVTLEPPAGRAPWRQAKEPDVQAALAHQMHSALEELEMELLGWCQQRGRDERSRML